MLVRVLKVYACAYTCACARLPMLENAAGELALGRAFSSMNRTCHAAVEEVGNVLLFSYPP